MHTEFHGPSRSFYAETRSSVVMSYILSRMGSIGMSTRRVGAGTFVSSSATGKPPSDGAPPFSACSSSSTRSSVEGVVAAAFPAYVSRVIID